MSKENPIDYSIKDLNFGHFPPNLLEKFKDDVIDPYCSEIKKSIESEDCLTKIKAFIKSHYNKKKNLTEIEKSKKIEDCLTKIKKFIACKISYVIYLKIENANDNGSKDGENNISLPILYDGIKHNNDDNLYFIIDNNGKVKYVGIVEEGGIKTRLNQHLIENNLNNIKSVIGKVSDYIKKGNDTIFVLTTKVTPSYLNKAAEKYYMETYWKVGQAEWNERG